MITGGSGIGGWAQRAGRLLGFIEQGSAAPGMVPAIDAAVLEAAGHVRGSMATGGGAQRSQAVQDARRAATLLDRIAPVSDVSTQRTAERPYGIPEQFEVRRIPLGEPLPLDRLDTAGPHIWVLDGAGTLHVAPERQPGFGVSGERPQGRALKHGDLTPTEDGRYRAPARIGGTLTARRLQDGALREAADGASLWKMDNNSSYSFARGSWRANGSFRDGAHLRSSSMLGVKELLETGGTEMRHLELRNFRDTTVWSPS